MSNEYNFAIFCLGTKLNTAQLMTSKFFFWKEKITCKMVFAIVSFDHHFVCKYVEGEKKSTLIFLSLETICLARVL